MQLSQSQSPTPTNTITQFFPPPRFFSPFFLSGWLFSLGNLADPKIRPYNPILTLTPIADGAI